VYQGREHARAVDDDNPDKKGEGQQNDRQDVHHIMQVIQAHLHRRARLLGLLILLFGFEESHFDPPSGSFAPWVIVNHDQYTRFWAIKKEGKPSFFTEF
jgi:hypothetical protein